MKLVELCIRSSMNLLNAEEQAKLIADFLKNIQIDDLPTPLMIHLSQYVQTLSTSCSATGFFGITDTAKCRCNNYCCFECTNQCQRCFTLYCPDCCADELCTYCSLI